MQKFHVCLKLYVFSKVLIELTGALIQEGINAFFVELLIIETGQVGGRKC